MLRSFFRDVAVWKATGGTGRIVNVDLEDVIARSARGASLEQIRARVAAIGRVEARQRNNQNRQYAVEGLALELASSSPPTR